MPGSAHWLRTFPLFIAVMLAGASSVCSQDANTGGRWQVIADCQAVVMPQKAALPLIPDLGDETKIEAAWAKVQKMIDNGQATLSASLFGRGTEGSRLVGETVEELRYPTEFAPVLPPLATPQTDANAVLKNWPVTGACMKSFETRNLGWTLELENTVSPDGKWIHAIVGLRHTRLLRFSKEEAGKLPTGVQMWVSQPVVAVSNETFPLQMHSGQRVLVSTHKVPDVADTMELAVLRIRTVPAGGGGNVNATEDVARANVRVDVQMVSVAMTDSLTLIPVLRDVRTVGTGWDRLQEMLANGRATLIDWPMRWARSPRVEKRDRPPDAGGPKSWWNDGRALSENLVEIRYPCDFDPPGIPQTFLTGPIRPEKPIRPDWEENIVPKNFETRNTGPTLEFEALVEDGGRIVSLDLRVQHIWLFGFQKWQQQASPIGISGTGVQPNFVSSIVTTSLRAIHDQPILVNVAVVPKPEPHVELFILRSRVMLLPQEAATPPLAESEDRHAPLTARSLNALSSNVFDPLLSDCEARCFRD